MLFGFRKEVAREVGWDSMYWGLEKNEGDEKNNVDRGVGTE